MPPYRLVKGTIHAVKKAPGAASNEARLHADGWFQ
jgi:hypothetical protein